ncbi:MAG: tetratricopeptide repeat protein [Flavobacteriales bacterium]
MARSLHLPLLALVLLLGACGGSKRAMPTATPEAGAPAPDRRAEVMRLFMEGTQARMGGQPAKAVAAFEQCLKLDPTNGAAHFELSKLYHQGQNFPKAVGHAKSAVAADKSNIWYRFLLADLYQQNQQVNEAIDVYRGIVDQWPDRYEVYFDLANSLAYTGKVAEAMKVYSDLEERIGLNEELVMQQYGMLAGNGKLAEAEQLALRAAAAFPNDPQYIGMLAEIYDQRGEHEKALQQYRKALELDPGNSMLRIGLAEHYYATGRMEEAYTELGEAFRDPEMDIDAKMQVLIGFFEMTNHEGEKPEDRTNLVARSYALIEALEKAHPESGKPHTIHGDFLLRDGRYAEARDQFRLALRSEKDRFPIHMQLLQLDLQLGDHQALVNDADSAIALFPTTPEIHLYKGIALSQLKRHDEAIEALITGRDLVVDNPALTTQFWSSLGDAYNEAGQFTNSDKAYEKVLAAEPDNIATLNNWAYYLSLRGEQLERAERMSKRSNELAPGSPTYQDTYAWVLFRMGHHADAKVWMEKAIAGSPEPDGVLLEHYGDILFEAGDAAAAVEQWRKAKAKGGASPLIDRKITEGRRVE